MSKKQSKADKAFIEKLKTINIGSATKIDLQKLVESMPPMPCPDCGTPMKCVGAAIVQIDRPKPKQKKAEEQSFSA